MLMTRWARGDLRNGDVSVVRIRRNTAAPFPFPTASFLWWGRTNSFGDSALPPLLLPMDSGEIGEEAKKEEEVDDDPSFVGVSIGRRPGTSAVLLLIIIVLVEGPRRLGGCSLCSISLAVAVAVIVAVALAEHEIKSSDEIEAVSSTARLKGRARRECNDGIVSKSARAALRFG